LTEYGLPFDDGIITLAKVASYRPNAWGLYDMIGNVEEWCEDEYRSRIPEELTDESAVVPQGPLPHHHIIRGGSWIGGQGGSGDRHSILAEGRREWIGFRVAVPIVRD
jgi:formylglycine-generating enzyme required for sulfatase activity